MLGPQTQHKDTVLLTYFTDGLCVRPAASSRLLCAAVSRLRGAASAFAQGEPRSMGALRTSRSSSCASGLSGFGRRTFGAQRGLIEWESWAGSHWQGGLLLSGYQRSVGVRRLSQRCLSLRAGRRGPAA